MHQSKDKNEGKIEKLRLKMEGGQRTWHPVENEGQKNHDIRARAKKTEQRIVQEWNLG